VMCYASTLFLTVIYCLLKKLGFFWSYTWVSRNVSWITCFLKYVCLKK